MKFLVLEKEIKYFHENGFIEFDEILSTQELEKLEKEIDNLMLKEKNSSPLDSYKAGRDLFRKSDFIKKIALNRNFSSIIKTLSKKRKLRLIFDQAIYSKGKNPFDEMISVDEIYSFQGLICAILLKIDGNSSASSNYLPKKKNNSMFYKSSSPINFEGIYSEPQKFFLLAYGDAKTIYKLNHLDPNGNFLKQFGYNFGDILKDEFHPPLN